MRANAPTPMPTIDHSTLRQILNDPADHIALYGEEDARGNVCEYDVIGLTQGANGCGILDAAGLNVSLRKQDSTVPWTVTGWSADSIVQVSVRTKDGRLYPATMGHNGWGWVASTSTTQPVAVIATHKDGSTTSDKVYTAPPPQ